MRNILRISTINELNDTLNIKTLHPLISIVDFSKTETRAENFDVRIALGFYGVVFKANKHCNIKYGRNYYDYQDGTLIFFAPEQVVEFEQGTDGTPEGWGLFFHPDLIRNSSLGKEIGKYSFFEYNNSEALHLSNKEKLMLDDILNKIGDELKQNLDDHSQTLIISNIELLLNYCARYYDRQFITRTNYNKDIVSSLERILKEYMSDENLKEKGLPTVKFCSEQLNLSANYLSDLLKKETGKNTQEHIHYFLIEKAKLALLNTNLSVSEISFNLGFIYPQYFSKIFKKKTGYTPNEFRQVN